MSWRCVARGCVSPAALGRYIWTCADRLVGLPGRRLVYSLSVSLIVSVAICVLPARYINGSGDTLALTLPLVAERALPRSLWQTLLVRATVLSSPARRLQ